MKLNFERTEGTILYVSYNWFLSGYLGVVSINLLFSQEPTSTFKKTKHVDTTGGSGLSRRKREDLF